MFLPCLQLVEVLPQQLQQVIPACETFPERTIDAEEHDVRVFTKVLLTFRAAVVVLEPASRIGNGAFDAKYRGPIFTDRWRKLRKNVGRGVIPEHGAGHWRLLDNLRDLGLKVPDGAGGAGFSSLIVRAEVYPFWRINKTLGQGQPGMAA